MVKCFVLLLAEHMLVQIVEVAAVFASDQPDTGVLNKSRNWGSGIGEGTEKRKNKSLEQSRYTTTSRAGVHRLQRHLLVRWYSGKRLWSENGKRVLSGRNSDPQNLKAPATGKGEMRHL